MDVLLGARHRVRIWQRRPPPGSAAVMLESAVAESEFILFCLPTTAHAEVAARIAPHLPATSLCLTIGKGLDERGRIPLAVLSDRFGAAHVAVLYGPMISEEICAGKLAFCQCGSGQPGGIERVTALFQDSALRVDASADPLGLSWSAILKNVYALAFGMADELGLGDNVRGFLAVAALHELTAIVAQLGGRADTPLRLAGLGDLITTATSAGSHHHELGRLMIRGQADALRGEGIHTLDRLRVHRPFDPSGLPLFRLIDECVQSPPGAGQRLKHYLAHWNPA